MSKIFYIMGKSASGKDSVYKEIIRRLPMLKPIVLHTTRPIREGEVNGKDYFFASREEMERLEAAGEIIERRTYHTIHGDWDYFTVDYGKFNLSTENYIGIGTLESYVKLKRHFGDQVMVPIYIEVEDGERLFRALQREQSQEIPKYKEMCRRFLADADDFSEEKLQQAKVIHRINNMDFNRCVEEVFLCIQREL